MNECSHCDCCPPLSSILPTPDDEDFLSARSNSYSMVTHQIQIISLTFGKLTTSCTMWCVSLLDVTKCDVCVCYNPDCKICLIKDKGHSFPAYLFLPGPKMVSYYSTTHTLLSNWHMALIYTCFCEEGQNPAQKQQSLIAQSFTTCHGVYNQSQ